MKKLFSVLSGLFFISILFSACSAKKTVTKIDVSKITEGKFVKLDLSDYNNQSIKIKLSADMFFKDKNSQNHSFIWKINTETDNQDIASIECEENLSDWLHISGESEVSIDSEKASLYLDTSSFNPEKLEIFINNFTVEIENSSGETKTFKASDLQANTGAVSFTETDVISKSNWIMDILFTGLGLCSLILGLIGAFLPVLPGPPLAWLGLLLAFFSSYNKLSVPCLIITAIIATIVTVIDTFMPTLMTKKFGGSKAATRGCTIGVFVGMFVFPPFGIIIGPFVGALIGEAIHTKGEAKQSFKSALGSFLGFITGCGLKFVNGLAYVIIFVLSFFYTI